MNAPTIIQRLANPRVVGRVTPCAPLLASRRTSFLKPPPAPPIHPATSPLASLSPPLRGGWRNPAPPIFGVCCGWSFGNGCPGSSRRSRGATLDISQLRSGWARTQGSCASWRDAGVSPSRQDGFGFATNPRHVGGIEGEWSYPEPPPVRFFLYQPHPGSRLNT